MSMEFFATDIEISPEHIDRILEDYDRCSKEQQRRAVVSMTVEIRNLKKKLAYIQEIINFEA